MATDKKPDEDEHEHGKVIFVNKKQIRVTEDKLTGRQILEKAEYEPAQYDLFLVHGQNQEKIEPDQIVEIKNGMHFLAILNSAPYG